MPDGVTSAVSRRRFLQMAGSAGLLTAFGGIAGCGAGGPVSIASHVWPGYEFMFLARKMGWLAAEDATLIETGSASESLQALMSGKAIGAALTLDETLRGIQMGVPLSIVLLFDVSTGGDALMVRPPIHDLASLKGARVGVETTALGALMLASILEKAGLTRHDVQVVNVPVDAHLKVWNDGAVDAIVSYDPVLKQIQEAGGVRLFDSREIPNKIFDVLAVHRDHAASYQRQLTSLIKAHFRGLRAWQVNPVDTAYRLSQRLGVRAEEVADLYRGLDLPDLVFNRHMLTPPHEILSTAAADIAAIMELPSSLVTDHLFSPNYLPADVE